MDMMTERFGFYHGATWMDLDGIMHIVPGFHDEWIKNHPELAEGARNVSEMVLRKRWLSVVVFADGYVEICLNDVRDTEVISVLHEFLKRNREKWQNVLVMPMIEEGFIQLSREEFGERDALLALLASRFLESAAQEG